MSSAERLSRLNIGCGSWKRFVVEVVEVKTWKMGADEERICFCCCWTSHFFIANYQLCWHWPYETCCNYNSQESRLLMRDVVLFSFHLIPASTCFCSFSEDCFYALVLAAEAQNSVLKNFSSTGWRSRNLGVNDDFASYKDIRLQPSCVFEVTGKIDPGESHPWTYPLRSCFPV